MKLIILSVLAILGVLLRYFLDDFISKKSASTFPLGIFIINILGCFLVGIVFALSQKQVLNSETAQIISIGFLGALTTFSAFSLDTFKLLFLQNQISAGLLYVFLSPLVGLASTWCAVSLTHVLTKTL